MRNRRMRIMRKRLRRQIQKTCQIESTMLLPCPHCKNKAAFGLFPIDLEQTIFSVALYCSCGKGLNGGVVIQGRLFGNRLEYVKGERAVGVFDPNKSAWEYWAA